MIIMFGRVWIGDRALRRALSVAVVSDLGRLTGYE
jgi:hypothetical protein